MTSRGLRRDDEGSEEDEEDVIATAAVRPKTTNRAPTHKSILKRSAPDGPLEDDVEEDDHSLFASLLPRNTAVALVAADWRSQYKADSTTALAELYTLVARVSAARLLFKVVHPYNLHLHHARLYRLLVSMSETSFELLTLQTGGRLRDNGNGGRRRRCELRRHRRASPV